MSDPVPALSDTDRHELTLLYECSIENIMYFKKRIFWLVSAFSAGATFLWTALLDADGGLGDFLTEHGVLSIAYCIVMSSWFIMLNNDCICKIQSHRQKMDRCSGFLTDACGNIRRQLPGFGDVFWFARAGVPREAARKANMIAYQDLGDHFIGFASFAHIVVFTIITIELFYRRMPHGPEIPDKIWFLGCYLGVAIVAFVFPGVRKRLVRS